MSKRSREQRRTIKQQPRPDPSSSTEIASGKYPGQNIPGFRPGMFKDPEILADFSEISVTQSVTQTWSGPIPDPDTLARFNEIEPGMASRIIKMAEDEGAHVRTTEGRVVTAAVAAEFVGLFFGWTIALVAIYCAYHLGMAGHEVVATVVGGASLAPLVNTFMQRGKSEKKTVETPEKDAKGTKR